jgi:repressor LexA
MELTPRQVDVITIIRNHKHLHGHTPTYREIAASLQVCLGTAKTHVDRMVKKGILRRSHKKSRTIEVVSDNTKQAPA